MAIEIYNTTDLRNIESDMSAEYVLMNDIDLGGANFATISAAAEFTGTLDGGGYKIYNGTIGSGGLIYEFGDWSGVTNAGTIKNLTLEVDCVDYVLTDYAYHFVLIDDCHFVGTGDSFIGYAEDGEIKNCTAERSNTSSGAVFVDSSEEVVFYRCTAKGNVSSTSWFTGCFVGGGSGTFTECGSEGNVTTTQGRSGGFAGSPYSSLPGWKTEFVRCYHRGNVNGTERDIGGFVGYTGETCSYEDCYATGDTVQTGHRYAGSFGGVLWQDDVAGITVKNCYGTHIVSGVNSGPFAGYLWPYDRWENCFYLDAAGQVVPADDWNKQGDPLTLTAMKQAVSFTGFDFTNVWGINPNINDGFPHLLWELEKDFNIWVQKSNVSRSVSNIWVQKSNVSREVTGVWVNKSGVWKQI